MKFSKFVAGFAVGWIILCAVLSVTFLGAIIWAIITLVQHFTH